MASDIYLNLQGIPGESTDAGHQGQIDVESFSWGATQTGAPAGSKTTTGKVQMGSFSVTVLYSKASPLLFAHCASGRHIPTAELFLRRQGSNSPGDFLKWKLTDVLVAGYQTGSGASETLPVEQVQFAFAKIEVEYKPTKQDGTFDAPIKAGWDLSKNTPITTP